MAARAVYSIRIFATGGLTAAAGVVGPVVPPGLVYVLRDVDVVEVGGAVPAGMFIKNQTLGELIVYVRQSTTEDGVRTWRGRQVYNEGEQVGFQAVNGTWSIAASGYQLTLP